MESSLIYGELFLLELLYSLAASTRSYIFKYKPMGIHVVLLYTL